MAETALYLPVKAWLEAQGFAVKGEVEGCDVVARREEPAQVVIAELKESFTLELLLQAADRTALLDGTGEAVWLAVRASRKGRDQDRRVHRLCRLLGVGLLAVGARGSVTCLVEAGLGPMRPNRRKRQRLLKEFTRRRGDPTPGGSTRRHGIMTAYRQQALDLAAALVEGPQRVRDLRATAPDAGTILLRNVYGWFARHERGVYALTPEGIAALAEWAPEGKAASQ
jgi:hypothetical protein